MEVYRHGVSAMKSPFLIIDPQLGTVFGTDVANAAYMPTLLLENPFNIQLVQNLRPWGYWPSHATAPLISVLTSRM